MLKSKTRTQVVILALKNKKKNGKKQKLFRLKVFFKIYISLCDVVVIKFAQIFGEFLKNSPDFFFENFQCIFQSVTKNIKQKNSKNI